METCIATFRQAADAKGVRLTMMLDAEGPHVRGDPARLQQVVCNLLANAIKFTPTGGEVQARVRQVESRVQISISDNGQGIHPQFLPFIFERFRQQDSSTTRRHAGLGLGLSIVKQLVGLHAGAVSAESAGEGQGAVFTVTLPMLSASGHPERRETPSAAVPGQSAVLRGLKILVVDDEADARELMRRVLDTCHAEVLTAASAGEALEVLKKERPSILVSDIGMPGKDGYELMREVRALEPGQGGETTAIALTAFARPEDRTQAMLAGYQIHIAKPIEPHELITALVTLVGKGVGGELARNG